MAAGRTRKRLTWLGRIIISVALLIVLPVLGIPAGFAFLEGWKTLDARNWQSLGTPAEIPTAIVDGNLNSVYVRGREGSVFECDHTGPTRDNACWKEVVQPRERGGGVEHGNAYRDEIPPPPGPVKEVLDLSWMSAERASYLRYALLEDGSVWLWDYHADANWSLALLMCGPICGLAVAIVIVLVSWLAAGLRALLRWVRARTGG